MAPKDCFYDLMIVDISGWKEWFTGKEALSIGVKIEKDYTYVLKHGHLYVLKASNFDSKGIVKSQRLKISCTAKLTLKTWLDDSFINKRRFKNHQIFAYYLEKIVDDGERRA